MPPSHGAPTEQSGAQRLLFADGLEHSLVRRSALLTAILQTQEDGVGSDPVMSDFIEFVDGRPALSRRVVRSLRIPAESTKQLRDAHTRVGLLAPGTVHLPDRSLTLHTGDREVARLFQKVAIFSAGTHGDLHADLFVQHSRTAASVNMIMLEAIRTALYSDTTGRSRVLHERADLHREILSKLGITDAQLQYMQDIYQYTQQAHDTIERLRSGVIDSVLHLHREAH